MKHPKLNYGQLYEIWQYANVIEITEDLKHIKPPVRLHLTTFDLIRENASSPRSFKFKIEGNYVYFLSQDAAGVFFQSRCGEYDFEIEGLIQPWEAAWIKNNAPNMTDPPRPKNWVPPVVVPKPRPYRIPGDGAWLGNWKVVMDNMDGQSILDAIDDTIALNRGSCL